MVTGNRRRDGLLDRPSVGIAAVAGVVIVVACALLFIPGNSGSNSAGVTNSHSSPTQGVPQPDGGNTGQNGVIAYNVSLTAGYELDDVIVPDKGTFIKVIYRGAYEGRYTSGNETQELRNSGERIFTIENPGPAVFAAMRKREGSTKQALTLEVWKEGTRLMTNTTSLPFGEVTVSGSI
ncbi:MAG: hypothetical protein M0Q92_02575 [Methanoregula sp.]|jgi:hypothetical protein|nr:hypothetical protein [Methanoregula sp.]